MYKKPTISWLKHLDFVIIDLISLVLSFLIAYRIRFNDFLIFSKDPLYLDVLVVISLAQLLLSFVMHNHDNILVRGYSSELKSVVKLAIGDLVFALLYLYFMHIAGRYSRLLLFYSIVIFAIIDYILRIVWKNVLNKYLLKNKFINKEKKIFVLTEKEFLPKTIESIRTNKNTNFSIKAFTLIDVEDKNELANESICSDELLKNAEYIKQQDMCDYIVHEWIDEVVIYLPRHFKEQVDIVEQCRDMGITTHILLDIDDFSGNKCFIEKIGEHAFVTTANNTISTEQLIIKRAVDIFVSLCGMFVTALMYPFVAIAIKKESPGPVIYSQKRVGRNGQIFTLYKFRSMYLDADERKKEYLKDNIMSDYMFKMDFDPRIIGNKILEDGTRKTGVGQFIRKTSIDEFPQFFNVFRGEMSVVGTRPPTEDEWNKYKYHHRARLSWKPGITGLWQVSGRNDIKDFEDVVKLDTEYICNYRVTTDIKIIGKTILKLLGHKDGL